MVSAHSQNGLRVIPFPSCRHLRPNAARKHVERENKIVLTSVLHVCQLEEAFASEANVIDVEGTVGSKRGRVWSVQ